MFRDNAWTIKIICKVSFQDPRKGDGKSKNALQKGMEESIESEECFVIMSGQSR